MEAELEKFVADGKIVYGTLPDGVIADIVRLELARTCLSCGAKEAADGTLPCNH